MKKFLDENFLLQTETAQILYHQYAKDMPIIDYHNHLIPEQIANDYQFPNLAAIWLHGDHYKWRAMRTNGISEEYITGKSSTDEEKFAKWAETVPYTMRNPLYHWTHLELARYFDIYDLLNEKSAEKIYIETTEKINSQAYSTQNLLKKVNAELVCTTEDPIDSLEFHQKLAKNPIGTKMSTAFRPDKAILISNDGYNAYLDTLGDVSGVAINTYAD